MSGKGKEKVLDSGGKGKRKCSGGNDKTGGGKRRNRAVLQFLDDTAYQVDEDEDYSDFDEDDFEEEFVSDLKSKDEPRKVPDVPFVPKEEEISEEEYERIMEERYKPGAGLVTNADNDYEHKRSIDSNIYAPSAKDPAIWKVKCTVGRERYSVFCLMQKYVDMEFLGTKLPIISSFAPDHVKGFILIEADKQGDIYEACNGICSIIPSRVTAIPNNEFARLLCVRSKSSAISKGMWARVKNGKYKDDLALVVAVNDAQKKVTVKLIPRIDLKAMAEKFGGGLTPKRTAIPPQRLISSSELDELRPLIRSRRDRDTKEMVEVLDGVMLKDGYVYKKVSIDSLSFWGVVPTDDELLKFEPSKRDDSTDVQWLSQLFGEKKTEHVETVIKQDKGSGKSEGSTSASVGNNFELHDLVFFGRKDFGVVVGQEKDDGVKVIKEGSDGPSVVTVKQTDLKSASFDKKLFSALDQHSNTISINDIVRVSNGPLKDRQGIVKKIYKGILFLCDESEQNNGYSCVKAQLCEKVNLSGKGSEPGPSGFADYSSSPKSPLSPDNSSQEKGHKISFQQREDDGMFSVGQSLRIRVGPLKGYLCRALAIRRSDVTVKLDSQQKILTVKSEHLSEVRGRNSTVSQGEETGSIKPCDFLATQDGASDWTSGAAVSTEGNKWNAGGSTERNSWSTLDSSNSLLSKEPGSADDNAKKGTEDSSWQIKASNESSSWAVVVGEAKQDTNQDTGGWGTSSGGWNQSTSPKAVNVGSDSSWGKAAAAAADTLIASSGDPLKDDNSWGAEAAAVADKWSSGGDASASKSVWGQSSEKQTGGAGGSQWGKSGDVKKDDDNAKGWGKADSPIKSWDNTKKAIEGAPEDHTQNDRWNKPNLVGAADSGPSWGDKKNDKSGWATSSEGKQDVGTLWNKPTEKSWGKQQESDLNKGSDKRGTSSAKSDGGNTSDGGWNMSKGSTADNNIKSPGWGGASAGNEGSGNGGGGSSWDNKVTKPHVSPKSSWKTDGNEKSSDWSAKGDWGSVSERKSPSTGGGSWKNADGGSSTGWGQGNWGKSGTSGDGNQESGWSNSKQNWSSGDGNNQDNNNSNDRGRGGRGGRGGFRGGRGRSDGNQESTWSGKSSNWGSGGGGGGFGDGNGQDGDSSGDRGRGGAGRWGRGGFQGGRGRSDFDGNRESTWSGKSNWSSGGGGFDDSSSGGGGRGGDRGGYDREGGGFRGRGGGGGFRGRGGRGGDWNNRGGDSNADINNNSWKTGSDQNSQGWKNGGGNSDGWKNSGGGSWNQTANDNNNQLKSWNSSSPKGGGGWNNNNNNNNEQSNVSPNKSPSSSWGTAPASGNSSGNWDKSDKSNEGGGPSGGSWGKGAATSSWGTGSGKW